MSECTAAGKIRRVPRAVVVDGLKFVPHAVAGDGAAFDKEDLTGDAGGGVGGQPADGRPDVARVKRLPDLRLGVFVEVQVLANASIRVKACGVMALTRIPCSFHSRAAVSVKVATAPLTPPYRPKILCTGARPAREVVLMITGKRPPAFRREVQYRAACQLAATVPFT